MPGPTDNGLALPRLVPVPPAPVHQVKVAAVPTTPLAVIFVEPEGHIGLVADVADVMPTFVNDPTVTDASAVAPQVPVTSA